MLGLASVLSLGSVDAKAVSNCTSAADAGKFCAQSGVAKQPCPAGCYCTGGTVATNKFTANSCNHVQNRCIDHNSACASNLSSAGVNFCPAGTPLSDNKAKTIDECYWKNSSGTEYHYEKKCNVSAGYYLPMATEATAGDNSVCKNHVECSQKTDLKFNEYCPGQNNVHVHGSAAQGIKTCPTGKRHTANLTGCEDIPDTVLCSPGAYLPANSETCTPCLDGRICPGALDENGNQTDPAAKGEYVRKLDVDQGLYFPDEICKDEKQIVNRYKSGCDTCDTGYKANDAHTECVDAEIEVAPGKYLPANRVQEADCVGTNKFCPGGKFWKKDFEQGRYDCPTGFEPKKSAGAPGNTYCKGKLNKDQMKEGFSGNGACWQKTDPADYRYCIYGVRFELPNNYIGGGKGPAVYSVSSIPYMQATISTIGGDNESGSNNSKPFNPTGNR